MRRGFEASEFQSRVRRAQQMMQDNDLSALLLTTEPHIRYFTGFLTRFWESPTRPWFLVLPSVGDPIAVIPAIGAHLMRQTWITDIRTWQAPNYADDGVGLLCETLKEVTGRTDQIGIPDQMESHVQMPLSAFRQMEQMLAPRQIVGDSTIMRRLRLVKSQAEIAKVTAACNIANKAFDQVPKIAQAGIALSDVFRSFQAICLSQGADWVPYLAGAAGADGYSDVISPATDHPLMAGDVLMLDTGLVWDGYFCDFDRNYSIGPPSDAVKSAHATLMNAVQAGFDASKPGAVISDVFHAMNSVVSKGGAGAEAGRLGHGLGMQLTEWPSIIAEDHTPLEVGMVLTLEPSVETHAGLLMVHEENIVITEIGAMFLSDFQPDRLRVI